jgi:hypothetical protein
MLRATGYDRRRRGKFVLGMRQVLFKEEIQRLRLEG